MLRNTCAINIFDTIDFQIKTSKNKSFQKALRELKLKITQIFEDIDLNVTKVRNQVKSLIVQSDLFQGAKKHIEKYLNKMK